MQQFLNERLQSRTTEGKVDSKPSPTSLQRLQKPFFLECLCICPSLRQWRYLGVMIDVRLNFRTNIEKGCEKAAWVNTALSRIMTNIGGPNQSRRLLLAKVTQSIMMYAAPVLRWVLEPTLWLQGLYSVWASLGLLVVSSFNSFHSFIWGY